MMHTYEVKLKDIIEEFGLEVLHAGTNLDTCVVRTANVNRPGLPFIGYFEHFDAERLQLIGRQETSYLTQMTPDEAATAAVADGRGYALGGFTAVVPEKVLAHPLAEYEICIAYRVGGFDFLASTGKTAEVKG